MIVMVVQSYFCICMGRTQEENIHVFILGATAIQGTFFAHKYKGKM